MNPKSIDERLAAITQTLEVVSHMQQASEKRIERLEKLAEGNEKRWDRLARAFEAGLREYFSENADGEGKGQTLIDEAEDGDFLEAEEAEFEAERTREFATWCKQEETKGRPKEELTFANFVKESAKGKQ